MTLRIVLCKDYHEHYEHICQQHETLSLSGGNHIDVDYDVMAYNQWCNMLCKKTEDQLFCHYPTRTIYIVMYDLDHYLSQLEHWAKDRNIKLNIETEGNVATINFSKDQCYIKESSISLLYRPNDYFEDEDFKDMFIDGRLYFDPECFEDQVEFNLEKEILTIIMFDHSLGHHLEYFCLDECDWESLKETIEKVLEKIKYLFLDYELVCTEDSYVIKFVHQKPTPKMKHQLMNLI